ncbi:hypothetical protein CR513_34739, partial [Mucuna pruriens]
MSRIVEGLTLYLLEMIFLMSSSCNWMVLSHEASRSYKHKIKSDVKYYEWYDPYLWKFYSDQAGIIDRIEQPKRYWIMGFISPSFLKMPTTLLPPTSSAKEHEMPQQPILFCKVFDVWGINFMGSFLISYVYAYILLVDYVSKRVMLKLLRILLDPIFFASLVCLKLSSMTRRIISTIRPCPPCLRSTGWCIGWLLLIIPKPMARPGQGVCKRWCIPIENIGANC